MKFNIVLFLDETYFLLEKAVAERLIFENHINLFRGDLQQGLWIFFWLFGPMILNSNFFILFKCLLRGCVRNLKTGVHSFIANLNMGEIH